MRNRSVFLILVITFFFNSCINEEMINNFDIENSSISFVEGMIELGENVENPFSLENMQKAVDNLYNSGILKSKTKIKSSHLYVRFLPDGEAELEMLKKDKSLIIYDYPLLCKMKKGGVYYHDPEIPEDQITWQYTIVPVEYVFPDIKYEILDEVFMDEDDTKLKSRKIDDFTYNLIETESFYLTGLIDEESRKNRMFKSTSWTPSGTITVKDNLIGDINGNFPLEGAYVRARNLLKTRIGITDSSGYFKVNGSFTANDVDMSIKWECNDFDIRSGSYGQAYLQGGDINNGDEWNVDINRNYTPKSWMYAHIHHGAFTYYYRSSQWGLKPPTGGLVGKFIHIAGKDKGGRAHYFSFNEFWQAATVVIYSESSSGSVHDDYEIFSTTIHELGHVAFWEYGYSIGQYLVDYVFRKAIMTESWSMCVENYYKKNLS